jgi:hypothetical protein
MRVESRTSGSYEIKPGFRVISKRIERKRKARANGDGEVIQRILCPQWQYEDQTDDCGQKNSLHLPSLPRLLENGVRAPAIPSGKLQENCKETPSGGNGTRAKARDYMPECLFISCLQFCVDEREKVFCCQGRLDLSPI